MSHNDETAQLAPETPADPPAEPGDDADGKEPAPAKPAPQSNLTTAYPRNTNGWYMVLAARVTERQPLRFRELGFIKCSGPDRAKEIAGDDPLHGPKLTKDAEEVGVVIRVVPAKYWPKAEPSGVEIERRLVWR